MDALTRETVQTESRSRRFRWGAALLSVLAIAAIIWAIWFFPAARPPSKKSGTDAAAAVPVLTVPAVAKDVPIYQDGLGTVQAFYTVTVKAMVDGPLVAVNVTEGQTVHKGDVLAQIDPRIYQAALDSAVAKKAQDEAQLANARLDLARYQKLVANNYTSAQQADTAKAQVAQVEAQVRQDQAQIDNARTELSYTTITAPIDGRTGIRLVDPGNIVHATDTTGLVVITQLQPIAVIFTLPQQALPAVTRAMQAGNPTALALAQGDSSTVLDTGTLTVLDNQVDPNTGTLKLKATFPNGRHLLWPGGFVTVRLRTDTAHDAVTVPPSVVQRGPDGSYLFVIGKDDKAQRRAITVGYQDEHVAIVTSGLKAGETVVTDGASRLADGTTVSIAKPDSNAPPRPATPTAPGTGRQRPGLG
ncbi:MAG TPA: efflux RND transporter periplasmic adaptor subunit [Rhodopila sp.]|nr:efflux RND transporter periplasmic adaptor subunit [Rhodopila sp.]